MTATTKAVSVTLRHYTIEDIREITLRVHGTEARRSNDWLHWRVCFGGRALSPSDIPHCNRSAILMVFPTGGTPAILVTTVVGIQHTSTTAWFTQFDLTVEKPVALTVAPEGYRFKKRELKLIEQGKYLLSTFATTMTARGRPEENDNDARRRLLTALLEVKQKNRVIDRETLSAWTKGVTSREGVAELLDRAGWAMTARSGKPIVKVIADRVHALRVRIGLSNLSIDDAVALAERAGWDLDRLEEIAETRE